MQFPSRETKPAVWLVLYWASQWLLAAGWILAAKSAWGEEWLTSYQAKPREYLILFAYGWFSALVLWPGAYFVLGLIAWWRRGMLALVMVLSLNALMWLQHDPEQSGERFGDLSFFAWLPFLPSTAVWWLMALVGRWRTVRVDDDTTPTVAPLSLRDLFLTITVIALCIPPIRIMVVSWQRDPVEMFDHLIIVAAGLAAAYVVPPMTLAAACIVRIAMRESRPSWAIVLLSLVLALLWLWTLLKNLPTPSTSHARGLAIFSACTLGAVTHACWLAYFLRSLGYRIRSRSWWART